MKSKRKSLEELRLSLDWYHDVFESVKRRVIHESANLSQQDAIKLRDDYRVAWSAFEKAKHEYAAKMSEDVM